MNVDNKTSSLPSLLVTTQGRGAILAAALLVVTVVVYTPAIRSGFVWDDGKMLTENIVLKANGLYQTWLTTEQPNYWPVTWTSYWLEHKLWGLNPTGYHIVNVLIHTVCALLIWRILLRLKIPGAWLAALVFAIHPVNVESAAWIAQRKNTLSMFFYLAALLLYLRFDQGGNRRLYLLAVVSFLLAMLSKGAVVTLPVVLLMCVWWLHKTISRRDLLRSLPFFAISAVMSVVEVWFQSVNVIGEDVVREDSFLARLAGAGMAVWFYLYKALLPIKLSFVYPRWQINPTNWLYYIPDLALLAVFVLCWRYRQNWGKLILFALGYFIAVLLPILGFFDIYFMRYSLVADHYQYPAIIGIIALVVAAGCHIANRLGQWQKRVATTIAALVVVTLGTLTWQQCRIYKDKEILWRDTLRKNPDAWLAHNNLGAILFSQGKLDEAIKHFRQILQIKPNDADAHYNLGNALKAQGKLDGSISHYRKALQIKPNFVDAHNNLGNALQSQGRLNEAISHYRKALQSKPNLANAHYNLGITLKAQGELEEAISHFRQALQIKPDDADAHYNIGIMLKAQGKLDEAISHYRHTIRIAPDYAPAHYDLGLTLIMTGRLDAALEHFREAVRLKSDYPAALNGIAQILTTHPDPKLRNVAQAIELAERAAELTRYRSATILNTLAAAYAAAGRFDQAVTTAQKALALASAIHADRLANQIRKRLELYRQAKPYRSD